MKLREFFLLKEAAGEPTFQSSTPPNAPTMSTPQAEPPPEQEELSRWERLPVAIQNYVRDIEKMCTKLSRRNDNDPELGEIIHKFLLELNKYMGEGE